MDDFARAKATLASRGRDGATLAARLENSEGYVCKVAVETPGENDLAAFKARQVKFLRTKCGLWFCPLV